MESDVCVCANVERINSKHSENTVGHDTEQMLAASYVWQMILILLSNLQTLLCPSTQKPGTECLADVQHIHSVQKPGIFFPFFLKMQMQRGDSHD